MHSHPPREHVNSLPAYLDALYGREDQGQVEVRYRQPGGRMRQRFYSPKRLVRASATLVQLAQRHDVWVGVAPRTARAGDLTAVARSWAVWIDCDGDTSALQRFAIEPSMLIASGSGPGHVHAYWLLNEPLAPVATVALNRRLALAAGGDPQATDAARILRPPGTLNHKHQPPTPVGLEAFTGVVHAADDVKGELPELPPDEAAAIVRSAGENRPRPDAGEDPLLTIEPTVYVAHLLGAKPNREGKVSCPFHSDTTPSLHAYRGAARGWACFGCGRGGSIYDLAGELWGYSTRGADFLRLRERLTDELL